MARILILARSLQRGCLSMIDYNQIKETLRAGIWDDLGAFFVDLENGDPRPDNQDGIDSFVSHKITSPYIPQKGYEQSDGDILTYVSAPTMTVSLTCYSKNKGDALNLAHKLKQWFSFHAYEYLKESDLIVSEVHPMSDRTTFLETGHDHRVGMDVTLRTTDTETKEINMIDKAELNNELIGE